MDGSGEGEGGEGGEDSDGEKRASNLACPFATCAKSFIWSSEFCANGPDSSERAASHGDDCDCWCPHDHGRVNGTGPCVATSRNPETGEEECGLGGVRKYQDDDRYSKGTHTYYPACDCFDGYVNGVPSDPLDPKSAKPCIELDPFGDDREEHLIDVTKKQNIKCPEGLSGPACEFTCANSGVALFDGSCSCPQGWGGPSCEAEGSASCNGNGESTGLAAPNACRCFADWSGDSCSFCSARQRSQAMLDDDSMYGVFYDWAGALIGISLVLMLILVFYEYRRWTHNLDEGLVGFQCCLPDTDDADRGGKRIEKTTWYPSGPESILVVMLLLRLFDFMSNWAFYSISAEGKLFKCDLRDRYKDDEGRAAAAPGQYKTAILFFTILGTFFFVYDVVDLYYRRRASQDQSKTGEKPPGIFDENMSPPMGQPGLKDHRKKITLSSIFLDDFPQIILALFFVSVTASRDLGTEETNIDSVTVLSLTLSIFSILFAFLSIFFGKQIGDKLKPIARGLVNYVYGMSEDQVTALGDQGKAAEYAEPDELSPPNEVSIELNTGDSADGPGDTTVYTGGSAGGPGDTSVHNDSGDYLDIQSGDNEPAATETKPVEGTKPAKTETFDDNHDGFDDNGASENVDANINDTNTVEPGKFQLEHELRDVGNTTGDGDFDGAALTAEGQSKQESFGGFDGDGGTDL